MTDREMLESIIARGNCRDIECSTCPLNKIGACAFASCASIFYAKTMLAQMDREKKEEEEIEKLKCCDNCKSLVLDSRYACNKTIYGDGSATNCFMHQQTIPEFKCKKWECK
jgi:hypothetical protein